MRDDIEKRLPDQTVPQADEEPTDEDTELDESVVGDPGTESDDEQGP